MLVEVPVWLGGLAVLARSMREVAPAKPGALSLVLVLPVVEVLALTLSVVPVV